MDNLLATATTHHLYFCSIYRLLYFLLYVSNFYNLQRFISQLEKDEVLASVQLKKTFLFKAA